MLSELNPFWIALIAGQPETALEILQEPGENQINVNEYCFFSTPLLMAAWHGSSQLVSHLLALGADVNGQQLVRVIVGGIVQEQFEPQGPTALCLAASKGNTEMVTLLLQAGADIEGGLCEGQRTKIDLCPLLCAVEAGHMGCVDLLLAANSNPLVWREGHSVATIAISRNDMKLLEKWLSLDLPFQEERFKRRFSTILHFACQMGNQNAVELLLARGADPNALLRRNKFPFSEESPLHIACSRGSASIARILLTQGADANLKGGAPHGKTALHEAALQGHVEIIDILLDFGADITSTCMFYSPEKRHYEGLTDGADEEVLPANVLPCHLAAVAGHTRVLERLFEIQGYEYINARDTFGYAPLHYAVANGQTDTVSFLLENGALLNLFCRFRPPVRGVGPYAYFAPLHIAAWRNDEKTAALLIQHGAVPDQRAGVPPVADTSEGATSLHCAALGNSAALIDILLAAGGEINASSRAGTPLHLSCWQSSSAMCSILIQRGADVGARDSLQNTPLHDDAFTEEEFDPEGKVEVLVKANANVGAVNEHLSTPLHLAAQQFNAGAVNRLLEAGADCLARDCDGETSLEVLFQETTLESRLEERTRWQERGLPIVLSLIIAGDRNWECVPEPCEDLELGLKRLWNEAPEELPQFFRKLDDEVKERMQEGLRVMHRHGLYLGELRMRILIEAFQGGM